MTMACCYKKHAEECDILVSVDLPAPHNLNLYSRLRFGLVSSSWLPSPLGIFLWSALHVMLLIVGGPVFWVLALLTAFLFNPVCWFGAVTFILNVYVVCGLFAVVVDLVLLFGSSIRFCWSLVVFLACHEPIVEWRGGACLTVRVWKAFKSESTDIMWALFSIGVPCMSGSLYKETKDLLLKIWARWFQEVVHMHEAIVL